MPGPTTAFNTITVTGTFKDFKGDPIVGSVTFTPSDVVRDLAQNVILFPVAITTTLVSGAFSVALPATDDPDITGSFVYTYAESWSRGRTLTMQVPVASPGGALDLSDVAEVSTPAASTSVATVAAQMAVEPTMRAAFLPGTAPADAAPRVKGYASWRAAYNFKAGNTRRLAATLAAAVTGTGLCSLISVGDSITAGYLTTSRNVDSWPVRMGNLLATRTGAAIAGGWVTPYYGAAVLDSRWSVANGMAQTYQIPYTGISTNTTGATATYVSTSTGTALDVIYHNTSATFTVKVDALTAVSVTPATYNNDWSVYTVTGLSNATHTVLLTGGAGGFTIAAARVRATSGISSSSWAYVGSTASDWDQAGAGSIYQTYRAVTKAAPDVVLLSLMANDVGAALPLAGFRTDIDDLVAEYLSVADVILVAPPPANGYNLATFRAAYYDVADSRDVPLIDFFDKLGSYSSANGLGLYSDGLHPNTKGAAALAMTAAMALT